MWMKFGCSVLGTMWTFLLPHSSQYTSGQPLKDRLQSEKESRYWNRCKARGSGSSRSREVTTEVFSADIKIGSEAEGAPENVAPIISFLKAGWGSERVSGEETSVENEMSVVQYALLNGHKIVLTADAGRKALNRGCGLCADRRTVPSRRLLQVSSPRSWFPLRNSPYPDEQEA